MIPATPPAIQRISGLASTVTGQSPETKARDGNGTWLLLGAGMIRSPILAHPMPAGVSSPGQRDKS
jgi:hypothetical protein